MTQKTWPTFFVEPSGRVSWYLRVYESSRCPRMPGEHSYHNAETEVIGEIVVPTDDLWEKSDLGRDTFRSFGPSPGELSGDPRWPTKCQHCAHVFTQEAHRQVFHNYYYRRIDTGEEFPGLRHAPIGAVWDATWLHDVEEWCGFDGRSLIVKLPDGHDWTIDSRASNCTMPGDNVHKCWVRHGRPEDGTLHVDKNGNTCGAGAGSILTKNWHGFLHNGQLLEC